MSDCLRARAPEGGASTSFLNRLLLATDATVTALLEAFAEEPVRAVILAQSVQPCPPQDADVLLVPPGSGVLDRAVLLCGATTRTPFLYSESLIVLSRLPKAFVAGLTSTDTPIGTMLRESRLETFRETLAVGRERAGRCAAHFGAGDDATLLYRTYRMLARQHPIMLITEKCLADH